MGLMHLYSAEAHHTGTWRRVLRGRNMGAKHNPCPWMGPWM